MICRLVSAVFLAQSNHRRNILYYNSASQRALELRCTMRFCLQETLSVYCVVGTRKKVYSTLGKEY
jgi:hypothetical protein